MEQKILLEIRSILILKYNKLTNILSIDSEKVNIANLNYLLNELLTVFVGDNNNQIIIDYFKLILKDIVLNDEIIYLNICGNIYVGNLGNINNYIVKILNVGTKRHIGSKLINSILTEQIQIKVLGSEFSQLSQIDLKKYSLCNSYLIKNNILESTILNYSYILNFSSYLNYLKIMESRDSKILNSLNDLLFLNIDSNIRVKLLSKISILHRLQVVSIYLAEIFRSIMKVDKEFVSINVDIKNIEDNINLGLYYNFSHHVLLKHVADLEEYILGVFYSDFIRETMYYSGSEIELNEALLNKCIKIFDSLSIANIEINILTEKPENYKKLLLPACFVRLANKLEGQLVKGISLTEFKKSLLESKVLEELHNKLIYRFIESKIELPDEYSTKVNEEIKILTSEDIFMSVSITDEKDVFRVKASILEMPEKHFNSQKLVLRGLMLEETSAYLIMCFDKESCKRISTQVSFGIYNPAVITYSYGAILTIKNHNIKYLLEKTIDILIVKDEDEEDD